MERREVVARLRAQSAHAQMWVEEGLWHDIGQLQDAAAYFESQIYPRTRTALGSEWTPGVDGDPHILILHAAGLGDGVAGYSTGIDMLPRAQEPFSNEAELITVSGSVEVGSSAYYALLARQLAAIIQWPLDRNEARWLEQGLADLAVRLNGIGVDAPAEAYLSDPDIAFAAEGAIGDLSARRGAAGLLISYFHERFQDEGTRALASQPLNGVASIEAVLSQLGTRISFEDLFSDWLAANYLDAEAGAVPLHRYDSLDVARPSASHIVESAPALIEGTVHPFGVDYIVLRGASDLEVEFRGVTETLVLDELPHGGERFWWSCRADESLATLARTFDLSGVEEATLTYWTWYDIEPGFDYAVVQVSLDDGETWQTVPAPGTTDSALGDNRPEFVYTGQSAAPPRWVEESVDLSGYTGADRVTVRFAYVTDADATGRGFALDDIALDEIGYSAGAEDGEDDWVAHGFMRTGGAVPQRYVAVLIGLNDRITVERLPTGEGPDAAWTIPLASRGWREAVLALSGLAPMTRWPAGYSLAIEVAEAEG